MPSWHDSLLQMELLGRTSTLLLCFCLLLFALDYDALEMYAAKIWITNTSAYAVETLRSWLRL